MKVVSASVRCDCVAESPEETLRRLEAARGSMGSEPALAVLWTKDLQPFEPRLERLDALYEGWYVQATINDYPGWIEPGTPPLEARLSCLRRVVERWGYGRVLWRYDPIIPASCFKASWHRARFAALAERLSGLVPQVTVSVVQTHYRYVEARLRAVLEARGEQLLQPREESLRDLLSRFVEIARGHGMALGVCAQQRYVVAGAKPANCVTTEWLPEAVCLRLGIERSSAPGPGHGRRECTCLPYRDIGNYGCRRGCVYCYANNPFRAR